MFECILYSRLEGEYLKAHQKIDIFVVAFDDTTLVRGAFVVDKWPFLFVDCGGGTE